jgi:hypothetical protein
MPPLQSWKHALFGQVQAGVTSTPAGVADTGTLVLWPGPDEPRTLSLIPPVHMAVLRASRLYASLPAAMAALQPQSRMPSNLLLVSGPSKTADIQQVLAYGAHGPKELIIVLVNDLTPGAGDQHERHTRHQRARSAAAVCRPAPVQGQHPGGGRRRSPAQQLSQRDGLPADQACRALRRHRGL